MSVLGEGVALRSQGEEGDRTKPSLPLPHTHWLTGASRLESLPRAVAPPEPLHTLPRGGARVPASSLPTEFRHRPRRKSHRGLLHLPNKRDKTKVDTNTNQGETHTM